MENQKIPVLSPPLCSECQRTGAWTARLGSQSVFVSECSISDAVWIWFGSKWLHIGFHIRFIWRLPQRDNINIFFMCFVFRRLDEFLFVFCPCFESFLGTLEHLFLSFESLGLCFKSVDFSISTRETPESRAPLRGRSIPSFWVSSRQLLNIYCWPASQLRLED